MEKLVLSLMCVSVLSLMEESLVQTVSPLLYRCPTGFNGQYCETGDSAISGRVLYTCSINNHNTINNQQNVTKLQ